MNLLVTGASGFLGRNVLLRAPADWRIVALYSTDQQFAEFVAGLNRPNILPVRCDLASPADVAALIAEHGADWECCLYLAAKVDIPWSVREPRSDLLANTVSLLNFLDAVRVEKFVYFSSGAVYDGMSGEVAPGVGEAPTLPYAISKLACEQYLRFHQHRRKTVGKCLIVRFFGAYGPYEPPHKIYTRLVRAFVVDNQHGYVIYGDGSNLIDAMFVEDAVDAIERMLKGSHWNDIINLAGGHPVTIEELVRTVATALGVNDVRIEKQGTANEQNNFWGSVREMRDVYGFSPKVSLADGICRLRNFLLTRQYAP
jgi:nucleoside-diphosphate-sugar epimerase